MREALAEGKLSKTRYDSYCAMYDEVKDVKDWQPLYKLPIHQGNYTAVILYSQKEILSI